ncbi:LuxR family transcriptional regulator [Kribbella capetownensis]|uniref:LuxR family transcriptional regulator n=1 Tax=Kribbella capetownensis TaxID=1572659 RepID=A0A4R0JSI8_9ACTN|nr:LuxR family transcriptional regulator [Kribbella capetownensis]TCC49054.1 LuxR family transcriptional regulator [Kribbella capetownensis]
MAVLLEREGAIAALVEHIEVAAGGDGRLVLLSGEAGVGKTSLVRHVAELARPRTRFLVGACDPLATPRPLGPLTDIVTELGAGVERALESASSDAAGPGNVFQAVLRALRDSEQPTIVVFEDLHWADGATLDLVRFLGRRIARLPAALVLTYRDDEIGLLDPLAVMLGDLAVGSAVHRLRLEPLTVRGVSRLATGRGLDAAELHRVTGGNPFFVAEVVRSGSLGIPVSVRDAVLARIARLPTGAHRLAEAVAVIGPSAPVSVLQAVLRERCHDALEAVPASGVLQANPGSVGFRHELARAAVVGAIPDFRRIELHSRVLEAMRGSDIALDDLPHLAYHAEEAGDTTAVRLFGHRAALHAAALGAHREAAAQYARVLRHATEAPKEERAGLLEGQAYAFYLINRIPEAGQAWLDAGALWNQLGARVREADDLRWASYMQWLLGRNPQAWEDGVLAVRLLQSGPPGVPLARAHANLAEQACFACDLPTTTDHAQKAIAIGGEIGALAVVVRARFHAALVRVLCDGTGWPELEAAWQVALDHDMVEQAGMFGPVATGVAAVHRDFVRSDRYAAKGLALSRDHDLDMFRQFLWASHALGLVHRGRWDEGAAEAAAVLEMPLGSPLTRIFAAVALALVRARRGEPDAESLLDEALTYADPNDLLRLGPVWEARAEVAWLCGDDVRAQDEARRGLTATHGRDPFQVGCVARWIGIAGGDPPALIVAGPAVAELAGDWPGARQEWSQLGCRYDAAIAALAGDVPALTEALETFMSLGARPAAARAKARLRQLGIRYGTRGPRESTRAHPNGLTSRQVEVLELVSAGLSSPKIAAQLHISPKTVEHHVAAILAKLGAHSRAEAVAKYRQRIRHSE